MLNYQEYEREVYDWLIEKNRIDSDFTFSMRQKSAKGAEKDYFIGTEKSGYFATTFWTLPVGFPGSSGDCIALLFKLGKKGYSYLFEVTQTTAPHDKQNRSALNLSKSLKPPLNDYPGLQRQSPDVNKMFTLRTKAKKPYYPTVDEMLVDIDDELGYFISLVNEYIAKEKEKNPDFIAHRITTEEFATTARKVEERLRKNGFVENEKKETTVTKEYSKMVASVPLNQILYGPPGTGKTFKTKELAVQIADGAAFYDIDKQLAFLKRRALLNDAYKDLMDKGQIVFTTFHQSMSYEDFVEGIKPDTKNGNVTYDIIPGIFKDICTKATDNWLDSQKGIKNELSFEDAFDKMKEEWEENNNIKFPMKREGNDYKIIGFTKTSIQFEKASGGTDHTMSIGTLRDYFYGEREVRSTGVGIYYPAILTKLRSYQPEVIKQKQLNNYVLIIDEINRGNVSAIFGELITLLEQDKRIGEPEEIRLKLPYSKENRFGIPPNLYIVGTMNTADRSVEALDTALRRRFSFLEVMPDKDVLNQISHNDYERQEIMATLNLRIEALLDRDHTLGHAYFIKKDFKSSFKNEIIPLLQEYFYNDYSKIALVLGEGFVRQKTVNEKKIDNSIFANFTGIYDIDMNVSYELIPFDDISDFDIALNQLLNR